jgi:hypothetical protein
MSILSACRDELSSSAGGALGGFLPGVPLGGLGRGEPLRPRPSAAAIADQSGRGRVRLDGQPHADIQRRPHRRVPGPKSHSSFFWPTWQRHAISQPWIAFRPSSVIINLDRLFADSHGIGHHRCETGQHKSGDHLTPEPIGEHQGLGDAARNVGKPSQCVALVACHAIVLM